MWKRYYKRCKKNRKDKNKFNCEFESEVMPMIV